MQIIIFYLLFFFDWAGRGICVAPAITVTSVICCAFLCRELIAIGGVRLPSFAVGVKVTTHLCQLRTAVLVILCGAGWHCIT